MIKKNITNSARNGVIGSGSPYRCRKSSRWVYWKLEMFFFVQAEDGIRDIGVTGVQTCALPILVRRDVAVGHEHRPHPHRLRPADVVVGPVAHIDGPRRVRDTDG